MVRLREDGTFSVCAVGYSVKLDKFVKKNECPCVAQWPSGGYLCAAWGSATPTIVDGKVINWSTPCSFVEAQTCPFYMREERADSKEWLYWVRRKPQGKVKKR